MSDFKIVHFYYVDSSENLNKDEVAFHCNYAYSLLDPFTEVKIRVQIIATWEVLPIPEFLRFIAEMKYLLSDTTNIPPTIPTAFIPPHLRPNKSKYLANKIATRISLALQKTAKMLELKLTDTRLEGIKIPIKQAFPKEKILEKVISSMPIGISGAG